MLATTDIGKRDVAQVLLGRREMLKQELRTLDQTLGFYAPEKSVERIVSREPQPQRNSKRPGPSAALLAMVKDNPKGLAIRDVVNGALASGVNSKAKDLKHMLRNTVDVLVKRAALVKLDGKLYPAVERAD